MEKQQEKQRRKCKYCGAVLPKARWMICESCQAAGFGLSSRGQLDASALLQLARQREQAGQDPLSGMTIEQVTAIARMFHAPYSTYGELRGRVDATGSLPGPEMERER